MALTMAEVARDYETDGVPSSGSHKIKKGDMRNWGAWVEGLINAFTANGGLIYTSKAAIDADLAHAANSMAWVLGDATVANNGVYRKIGASGAGSWTRVSDLPFSFIIASDVGAGTANAIQATTSIPVSGSALVWANIFEANTASPVTISFNGGSALTIKTNAGNNVAVGGLTAGMIVMGIVSGSTFRLVSDQASSAIVAAAEGFANAAAASATAAAASAASINLPSPVALNYLRQKADLSGYEARTPAQVASDINVQQRNADGGLSFSLTIVPSVAWGGPFGGTWNVHHRYASSYTSTHVGAAYATAAFLREVTGSGANGPANADYASVSSSVKTNYLTSAADGEVDVEYHVGRQGQKADLGSLLSDLEKVGGDTGGMVAHESATRWVNNAGTVVGRQQSVDNYAGQGSGFYGQAGVSYIGSFKEMQVGVGFAAYLADQVGGGASYQHLLFHTQGRNVANKIFGIDGAGRVEAASGAAASQVAYGFVGDNDTGLRRLSANAFAIVNGGTDRWAFDGNGHHWPIADNTYDIGVNTTNRLRNLYIVNAPTVGSDERDKIRDEMALGLDFLLQVVPEAYRLKEGGGEFETVEEWIDVEEIVTEEKEVEVEYSEFIGSTYVKKRRTELQRVPVYDEPIPLLNEDGTPVTEKIPTGVTKKQGGKTASVTFIERPVLIANPRKHMVKKKVERQVLVKVEGKRTHYGFMAQQIKTVLDSVNASREAVGLPAVDFGGWVKSDINDPNSKEALRYEEFIAVIVKALQEIHTRQNEMDDRLREVERKLTAIERQV